MPDLLENRNQKGCRMESGNDISTYCLPDNLRALRKRMRWSQEELAEKIGLNRGNIASYENGTAEPKICNLVKMAHLFKVSVYDLTHSNLRTEEAYISATQRNGNGNPVSVEDILKSYLTETDDFENAIKGIRFMFKLKLKNMEEIPEELKFMQDHFEQLYSLSEELLNSHKGLLEKIKCKCQSHHETNCGG